MGSHWLRIGAWNPFDDSYHWIDWEQLPTRVNALNRFGALVAQYGGDRYDGPPLMLVDSSEHVVARIGLRFTPAEDQTSQRIGFHDETPHEPAAGVPATDKSGQFAEGPPCR